ncbi:hypothetical protein [Flavivirga spongiicola]|uniref:Peptidase M12B domain-containing protein n=1 Tax=Flavivirga spongiicola TaxID=421621 RepID=A0ABU7XYP3_9FLAO|nr:hypothetical protein [Flavivirga sp. MEBiC05379]MDO5980921.1 hypothetical protein [Flavivirga sp. MEBiC05379]
MIDLILQVTHVAEFNPTKRWRQLIVDSLSQLGLNVEIKIKKIPNVKPKLKDFDLHILMNKTDEFKQQAILEQKWYINLLIVHSNRDGDYGSMFSNFGNRKRQGCAVFLNAIKANFNATKMQAVCARTSIHEIGHIFNFCHPSNPDSDNSVMIGTEMAKHKDNWLETSSFHFNRFDKATFLRTKFSISIPGKNIPFHCA